MTAGACAAKVRGVGGNVCRGFARSTFALDVRTSCVLTLDENENHRPTIEKACAALDFCQSLQGGRKAEKRRLGFPFCLMRNAMADDDGAEALTPAPLNHRQEPKLVSRLRKRRLCLAAVPCLLNGMGLALILQPRFHTGVRSGHIDWAYFRGPPLRSAMARAGECAFPIEMLDDLAASGALVIGEPEEVRLVGLSLCRGRIWPGRCLLPGRTRNSIRALTKLVPNSGAA